MKYLVLLIMLFVIAGCASVQEGEYVAYRGTPQNGADVIATGEYGGYTVRVLSGAPSTPTPLILTSPPVVITKVVTATPLPEMTATRETGVPTPLPGPGKCELRILNYNHNIRSNHSLSASIIINIPRLQGATGISFWYDKNNVEWARVSWRNNEDDAALTYTGWILVDDNVEYNPLGPCIDLPSEEENPLPPTLPPSTGPTPTPIQAIYACSVGTGYLNIRLGPGTNYEIVGRLEPGIRLRIVTKLDNGWWEIVYGSLPGQYIAGWLAREC